MIYHTILLEKTLMNNITRALFIVLICCIITIKPTEKIQTNTYVVLAGQTVSAIIMMAVAVFLGHAGNNVVDRDQGDDYSQALRTIKSLGPLGAAAIVGAGGSLLLAKTVYDLQKVVRYKN